ncbi:YggS family pyridoxal phosphate enzyme, partial [Klebsiella pneumoniae]|nr:YggS family pyridoxal phosphate enzyme [Klebsiella pneumoniae]
GMSDDMESAIAAGRKMVRIGTAIYCAREYSK